MYKVIVGFTDLRDDHVYKVGDKYPHSGEVDAERIKYLKNPTPMRGALIEEAKETEKVKETKETEKPTTRRKKKED